MQRQEKSGTKPQRRPSKRGPSKRAFRDLSNTPLSELPPRLRVGEFAQVALCSERTVRQWIADGLLRVIQPGGPGGHTLITREEVIRVLGEREPSKVA